jgi:hypothetical protein
MGIGDWGWGLGIGDWAQSPIPNPQSPIPNPQSPLQKNKIKKNNNLYNFKNKIKFQKLIIIIHPIKIKK